jgi:hypothetical protein
VASGRRSCHIVTLFDNQYNATIVAPRRSTKCPADRRDEVTVVRPNLNTDRGSGVVVPRDAVRPRPPAPSIVHALVSELKSRRERIYEGCRGLSPTSVRRESTVVGKPRGVPSFVETNIYEIPALSVLTWFWQVS